MTEVSRVIGIARAFTRMGHGREVYRSRSLAATTNWESRFWTALRSRPVAQFSRRIAKMLVYLSSLRMVRFWGIVARKAVRVFR